MIPALATIVAAYAGFRIIEILLQVDSRHQSKFGRVTIILLGILALIVIGWFWLGIITGGVTAPSSLGQ